MQTFGRLEFDVDNCMRELAAWGVAERAPGSPPRYRAAGRRLLDDNAYTDEELSYSASEVL